MLISRNANFNLTAFVDANWAGSLDDKKSTGGYLIYMGNNLISWQSKKQQTVARSSTETKFKAVANVTIELWWLTHLLHELRLPLIKVL